MDMGNAKEWSATKTLLSSGLCFVGNFLALGPYARTRKFYNICRSIYQQK